MEPGFLRSPAKYGHGFAIPRPQVGVIDGDSVATQLHLAVGAVPTGDDAVHEHPAIAKKVQGLARLPHHRQPQVAFEEQWFDRTQPWSAVAPDRRDEEHASGHKPLLCQLRKARSALHEVVPPRAPTVRRM